MYREEKPWKNFASYTYTSKEYYGKEYYTHLSSSMTIIIDNVYCACTFIIAAKNNEHHFFFFFFLRIAEDMPVKYKAYNIRRWRSLASNYNKYVHIRVNVINARMKLIHSYILCKCTTACNSLLSFNLKNIYMYNKVLYIEEEVIHLAWMYNV